ncbi:rna-directed dna polymerase from mobile element jockey-like [Limosa lapponica baueri]|uniref:Rna-directed dna polymerase from mobile element jockey-like n=1 Tax=Limosa lapponica baueri TaxID=1758121 RepID=A0A2I0TPL6_LIMLA|nr:rna-directed dna polymerase from mobile element jockey-like [Limosa lapponica baueri]
MNLSWFEVVEEPIRKEALLDLALTNKEGLVEDIEVGGNLGCSDHAKTEFRIMGSMCKATSRIEALDFRSGNFDLFKKMLGDIPWVRALEGRGAQESWTTFKYHFLQAKYWCIPKSKKSGKGSRRPVWLSRELLKKLKWKKDVYTEWKKGLTTWDDCKNAVRVCRDEMRKAMVTEDAEKAELLNAIFASVFTAQATPQESQTWEVTEKVWTKEDVPSVEEDQVRDQLSKLDIRKSMGPDGMRVRVLRELAEVIAGPLSIIFERSWRTGEVPEDWRKANVTPVFKKGKKDNLGNYRPFKQTVNLDDPAGPVRVWKDAMASGLGEKRSEDTVLVCFVLVKVSRCYSERETGTSVRREDNRLEL